MWDSNKVSPEYWSIYWRWLLCQFSSYHVLRGSSVPVLAHWTEGLAICMVSMQTQACLCVLGEKVSSYWPYLPAGHLPPNWPDPGQGDQAQCVRGNISAGSGSSVPAPHCAKYVTLTSSIIMKLGKSIISFCHIAYPSYKWRYRDSDSFHCFFFNHVHFPLIAALLCSMWITVYVTVCWVRSVHTVSNTNGLHVYTNVSQTSDNHGPLHRWSAHTWTTFVKISSHMKVHASE